MYKHNLVHTVDTQQQQDEETCLCDSIPPEPTKPTLHKSRPRNMTSVNNVAATPSSEVQDRLFKIANQVALKYAKDYSWSTWHSWNVVNQAAGLDVGLLGTGRSFWHTTGRFATCLGVSTRIVTELQATIGSSMDRGFRQYANHVHLMTCARHAGAETKYHAVVGMCLDTFALVIDHALHPVAMEIPLGGAFYTAAYIPLSGPEGMERFRYFRQAGEFKLTMDNASPLQTPTRASLYFSEMDVDATTTQLAIPAALELQPVKGQSHILMPPRKHVSVRSLLDEKPALIAAEPVDGKWLATTLRVQLDFASPMLTVQIPMADWIMKPQGKGWLGKLCHHAPPGLMLTTTDATVLLQVELDAENSAHCCKELKEVEFLSALCGEFGLRRQGLMSMVDSVYRTWTPYRLKRADSIIDGEVSGDGV
ncbi:uncharacterized protein EKO05_0010226 [Ascochyta rabiei]|uniref:Uncharacterized protein n=1 Tax=Didymella rabiei TaxID=5454 RepID=A0A162WNZ2_DIDRA|nr:uncharacterized protein EKO05_0010226 [Ascochyta rabiei]KZM19134.1 hypothetical protein ST47_g9764 [Ascochyta rabiei]UPX19978.1 hypothetical protein EKO05_0010226 [Ascochyta rabiei]